MGQKCSVGGSVVGIDDARKQQLKWVEDCKAVPRGECKGGGCCRNYYSRNPNPQFADGSDKYAHCFASDSKKRWMKYAGGAAVVLAAATVAYAGTRTRNGGESKDVVGASGADGDDESRDRESRDNVDAGGADRLFEGGQDTSEWAALLDLDNTFETTCRGTPECQETRKCNGDARNYADVVTCCAAAECKPPERQIQFAKPYKPPRNHRTFHCARNPDKNYQATRLVVEETTGSVQRVNCQSLCGSTECDSQIDRAGIATVACNGDVYTCLPPALHIPAQNKPAPPSRDSSVDGEAI